MVCCRLSQSLSRLVHYTDQSDQARHGCCRNMYFLFSQDLALMLGYYVKVAVVFTWLLGGVWPMLKFYFMMRLVNK